MAVTSFKSQLKRKLSSGFYSNAR